MYHGSWWSMQPAQKPHTNSTEYWYPGLAVFQMNLGSGGWYWCVSSSKGGTEHSASAKVYLSWRHLSINRGQDVPHCVKVELYQKLLFRRSSITHTSPGASGMEKIDSCPRYYVNVRTRNHRERHSHFVYPIYAKDDTIFSMVTTHSLLFLLSFFLLCANVHTGMKTVSAFWLNFLLSV